MRSAVILSLALAACTGDINSTGDDNPTMPPPPPPSSDVRVLVQDGTTPQPGVRVIFQNADGSTLSEATTDATGAATAQMPSGGNLTVVRTYPPVSATQPRPAEIYTYVGVKAGDVLQLGKAEAITTTPSAININVPAGAQGTVRIVTPCGSGEGTGPIIPITVSSCPSQVPIYIRDDNNNALLKTMPYSENIDLTAEQLAGNLSTSLSASNLPSGANVSVELRIVAGLLELFTTTPRDVTNNPQTVQLPNVQGVDELVIGDITTPLGEQMIATRGAYQIVPTSVDASANLIAYVKGTPTYAPTGVSWAEDTTGGLASPEFVIATLTVTKQNNPGTGPDYIRAIIAPHTGTSLPLPLLVGADASYNPTSQDQIAGALGLGAATGAYDAARAKAFAVSTVVEAAPVGGTVTLSYTGTPPAL